MRQRHGRTDGAALTFYLWAFALERTTPTRVAISVTVNPITASLFGAVLLDEPLRWNLMVGIAAVFIGIFAATTAGRPRPKKGALFKIPDERSDSEIRIR